MNNGRRTIYLLAIAFAIGTWMIAIRSPLWLDETISTWQISAGFNQILSRQGGLSFPAYSYILWLVSRVLGTSEMALRVPSVVAMLAACYLLFLSARQLFEENIAFAVVLVFSLQPIVVFASIDVRPYAFAVLSVTATTYCLVKARRNPSTRLAVLIGVLSAIIVYFHLLFVVLLPPIAICLLLAVDASQRTRWKMFWIAATSFTVAFLPVIPRLAYMFRTSEIHVFEGSPPLSELVSTVFSLGLLFDYAAILILASVLQPAKKERKPAKGDIRPWICLLLGFVPLISLYVVSVATTIHVFTPRYRLVAIPGIALFWGLALTVIELPNLRLLFCVLLTFVSGYQLLNNPLAHHHGYTWKYALETAEQNARLENATVVICSDFPESDFMPIPDGEKIKDSPLFTPLSYYKLTVPVVGLPRSLNDVAIENGDEFLQHSKSKPFLAMGFDPSYETLDWLKSRAIGTHDARELGVFDGVRVLEFTPSLPAPAGLEASPKKG